MLFAPSSLMYPVPAMEKTIAIFPFPVAMASISDERIVRLARPAASATEVMQMLINKKRTKAFDANFFKKSLTFHKLNQSSLAILTLSNHPKPSTQFVQ